MNKTTIQSYINNFRREISRFIKPNIGISFEAIDCQDEGAILTVRFLPGGSNEDKFLGTYQTIGDGLSQIEQNIIGGSMKGIRFHGTNMSMDRDKVIIIKDNSPLEWSTSKVSSDLNKIIHPPSISS